MVVGYRLEPLAARLRRLAQFPSFVLPNLVLERDAFPGLLHETCTATRLADELGALLTDGAERRAQLAALTEIRETMRLDTESPSKKAAQIVLDYAGWSAQGGRSATGT